MTASMTLTEGLIRECPRCRNETFRFSTRTHVASDQEPQPAWLCVNSLCRHLIVGTDAGLVH